MTTTSTTRIKVFDYRFKSIGKVSDEKVRVMLRHLNITPEVNRSNKHPNDSMTPSSRRVTSLVMGEL